MKDGNLMENERDKALSDHESIHEQSKGTDELISGLFDKCMMARITSDLLRIMISDFLEGQDDVKKQTLLEFLHYIEQGDSLDKQIDKANYGPEYIKFRDQHCPGVCLDDPRVLYRFLYEKAVSEEKLKEKGLSKGGSAYLDEFFPQFKKRGFADIDEICTALEEK